MACYSHACALFVLFSRPDFLPLLSSNRVHRDFPTVYSPLLYIPATPGIPMLRDYFWLFSTRKNPSPFLTRYIHITCLTVCWSLNSSSFLISYSLSSHKKAMLREGLNKEDEGSEASHGALPGAQSNLQYRQDAATSSWGRMIWSLGWTQSYVHDMLNNHWMVRT